MKTTHILMLLTAPLWLSNCRKAKETYSDAKLHAATAGDVTFARKTFEGLAKGESSVADKIDWPVFTSLGENLGASYTGLASGVERDKLVGAFITQFAIHFREGGGSLESFTNWRVTLHDAMKTEVAADTPNGVLTVVVAKRDGVERVSSINIVK